MNEQGLPPLLTPEQVAKLTGLTARTIRARCREGDLPAKRIGRRWYVLRDELLGVGR